MKVGRTTWLRSGRCGEIEDRISTEEGWYLRKGFVHWPALAPTRSYNLRSRVHRRRILLPIVPYGSKARTKATTMSNGQWEDQIGHMVRIRTHAFQEMLTPALVLPR
jgi:hypothetical protein